MHLNPVGIRSTHEYQHAYPFIAVSLQIVTRWFGRYSSHLRLWDGCQACFAY
jgi:hypothetical protein